MDEIEKRIRRKLRDDFEHYASKCLKIRGKNGNIANFDLNQAQRYIHQIVEKQKREKGKVRAIILKGRQQGCCFSEQMKVLTSDYRWVKISDVQIGDRLVACDENSSGKTRSNRNKTRKFRTAIVEDKREFVKEAFEILFDNGAKLEVTENHRMLCKKRGGDDQQWRKVGDFKIGDLVRVVMRPPNYNCQTYEDGWIAGMIDGEGSARLSGSKRISIHERNNKQLDRVKKYLNDIGIPFKEVIDKRPSGISSKLGKEPVHRIDIHRLPYFMEIFSRCRPIRFTNDEWHVGHELPGKAATDDLKPWAKVISIKSIGEIKVVDLQTSEKTFICEGLVSHNSTYIEGRFYWRVTHSFGTRAFILTHHNDATNNLFEMAKRYHDHCPLVVRPTIEASNAKELSFSGLDSGYKLGTAGNKDVGRSSTIQLLHGSEVAYWPNSSLHAKGILQAVPDEAGTEIFFESTANGIDNYFHQQWLKALNGESDFVPIFVPWFWQDEYRKPIPDDFQLFDEEKEIVNLYGLDSQQILWRREKIVQLTSEGKDGLKAFKQEYPCNATEAFQMSGERSFIDPEVVMLARKRNVEPYGKLLIGVDPARQGKDRTSIIRRRGPKAYNLENHIKANGMEVAGIVHMIIQEEDPFLVFIDEIGLGGPIYDRLCELGHKKRVVCVNSAKQAINYKRFGNRRAEGWSLMRDWFFEKNCQIPDDDKLHADLCGPQIRKPDSNGRLLIQSKEEMERSPDNADALSFTFFLPDTALLEEREKDYNRIGEALLSHSRRVEKLKRSAYG